MVTSSWDCYLWLESCKPMHYLVAMVMIIMLCRNLWCVRISFVLFGTGMAFGLLPMYANLIMVAKLVQ